MAVALASLAPVAVAATKTCTNLTSASCPGAFCTDQNGDQRFTSNECRYVYDPCQFQSDCCSTTSGFWCPEYEES